MRILLSIDKKMIDLLQKEKLPLRAELFVWVINAIGAAFAVWLVAKAFSYL